MTPNNTIPNSNTQSLEELAILHASILSSNQYLGSHQGNVQIVAKEPWIDEPAGSLPLDIQNGITLPAIDGLFHTVVSYIIPQGWDSIFDGYNVNIESNAFVEFQGDVVWQFAIDGRIIEGFDNVTNSRGSIMFSRSMHTIKVTQGQTITIQVKHVANVGLGAGPTVCGLKGYRYPKLS